MHDAALLSFSHFFGQVRSTHELTDFLLAATSRTAAVEAGTSK